jgi:hypothetical protein
MGRLLVGMLLLLLIAGCSNADGDDLIVLQDASHRTGTLQGCLSGRCQLNGRAIPQATIAWIGLHQARSNPPQPNDPAVAEIRMIDRSVHPGLMTAIDPTRVTTLSGSYDRQKVAWVYLTHPAQAAASSSTSPTGSSAGPDNCGNPTIIHYDVRVTVHTDDTNTFPPPGVLQGTMTSVIDWETHWANVAMSVERCHGNLTILIPAGVSVTPDEWARQSIAADTKTFTWMDNTEVTGEDVPPCHFTNVTTVPAGMFLQGRGPDFQFFAARPHRDKAPREPFLQKCDARRNRGGTPSGTGLESGFARNTPGSPVNHLDFAFSALNINLSNHVKNGTAYPLAELALGQGFTFNSGELHATGMDGSGHVATTEWASVSVNPVHP